jgi:hypothetical protein
MEQPEAKEPLAPLSASASNAPAPSVSIPRHPAVFDRIMQLTDNAGGTDEHRALNFLAVRYPAFYAKAAEEFARNSSLVAVDVRLSPLSGTRRIGGHLFVHEPRYRCDRKVFRTCRRR